MFLTHRAGVSSFVTGYTGTDNDCCSCGSRPRKTSRLDDGHVQRTSEPIDLRSHSRFRCEFHGQWPTTLADTLSCESAKSGAGIVVSLFFDTNLERGGWGFRNDSLLERLQAVHGDCVSGDVSCLGPLAANYQERHSGDCGRWNSNEGVRPLGAASALLAGDRSDSLGCGFSGYGGFDVFVHG